MLRVFDLEARRKIMLSIARGILTAFDPASYTASVLLLEATSSYLTGVPVSTTFDGTSAQVGDLCAILFFDASNQQDAVILAVYPNGSSGAPTPPPGRVTFFTGYQQFSATTINSGATSTFTVTGGSTGIPLGALGVLCKASFSSPTAGAFLHLAPHTASDITAYMTLGNIQVASSFVYGGGLLPVDGQGKIDIKANVGNCTVWLTTYGYVF
jgi:hypothetical protein